MGRIGLNCGIAVVVLGVLDILSFACISRDLAACLGQLTRAAAIAAPYLFGRPEQIRRLDWLWDLGRRIGSSQLALVCRGCRAMVLPEFIDLPATKREIEAVLEEFVADNPDDRLFRVKMLRQLAGMQYEMAKFDDAIAYIDRAITELERNQIASPFPRLDLMCLKANALSRRGDLDEAISSTRRRRRWQKPKHPSRDGRGGLLPGGRSGEARASPRGIGGSSEGDPGPRAPCLSAAVARFHLQFIWAGPGCARTSKRRSALSYERTRTAR